MRINGSYIERYLFTIFPWTLIAIIYCYFGLTKNLIIIIPSMLLFSQIFIFIDYISIRKNKLSRVILLEDGLYVNGQIIKENDILIIRPFKTAAPSSILIIELYLSDGKCLSFIDKPKTFLYKFNNKINSKSLDLILTKMPSLKKKIRAQNHY
jgi:hypothetical protein